MTRKRHSDPIWNSCAHHIAHGGPTEVVHQNWTETNRLLRARPRLAKIANRLSVAMKHKWAIEPAFGVRTFHYRQKLAREWQDAAILVLADFRPQVNDLAGKTTSPHSNLFISPKRHPERYKKVTGSRRYSR